jgi:hypothetical protein
VNLSLTQGGECWEIYHQVTKGTKNLGYSNMLDFVPLAFLVVQ